MMTLIPRIGFRVHLPGLLESTIHFSLLVLSAGADVTVERHLDLF